MRAGLSRRRFLTLTAASVPLAVGLKAAANGVDTPATGALAAAQHFVLIHGAWHGAWCWYKITAALERHGQRVTAIDLPAAGVDATPAKLATRRVQVDRVVALLDTLDGPVILVGHSAGGPIISSVADARPDKIAKLVYLTAFLLPDGVSLAEVATMDPGSLLNDHLISGPEEGTFDVEVPVRRDVFYNLCNRRDVALAQSLFKPVAAQGLVAPLRIGASFAGVRRFYISCLADHAISPAVQESMYRALPCEKVLTIQSDHSPFFSRPRQLLNALSTIAAA